ncbi:hypothetical protein OG946_16290 [Streptomyces sp. NBC_01808]|nr:hypothetical protein [Streptomyces sp. NBC_01808]WSA38796.1 hypothetical protein OG946_16290 [Streptomyces sp. NBC_01808]
MLLRTAEVFGVGAEFFSQADEPAGDRPGRRTYLPYPVVRRTL